MQSRCFLSTRPPPFRLARGKLLASATRRLPHR